LRTEQRVDRRRKRREKRFGKGRLERRDEGRRRRPAEGSVRGGRAYSRACLWGIKGGKKSKHLLDR
jgi:hypothetical protein